MKENNAMTSQCPQNGRSERPECGADAPAFLSAVYKRGTQAKKRPADVPQYGRSMIEMLGVLAIIGVLSVGGIMGYSKAMFRYKINKTIEQITYIAGNVRTTFASQVNYKGLSSYCPPNRPCALKKAHIVPDDMWKAGENYTRHVWDGEVYIGSTLKNSADTQYNKAFKIEYYNIPEEACIELITHDWKNAQVKMIYVYNSKNSVFGSQDLYFIPPAKLDDAIKLCDSPNDDSNDVDGIYFYFEVDTSDSFWKDYIDRTTAILAGS